MAHTIYKNNSKTLVVGNVSDVSVVITVADGTQLPSPAAGEIVYATLRKAVLADNEVISYTSLVGNTVSGITRNVSGTGALTFVSNDLFQIRIPNTVLSEFIQRQGTESSGGNRIIGNLEWSSANGPTIVNENPSAINPVLIPDRTNVAGGVGSGLTPGDVSIIGAPADTVTSPGHIINITAGIGGATSGDGGSVLITSGNSPINNSGNIILTVGTAGGTQGAFKFTRSGDTVTAGNVWTASAADGTGYWAAAAGGAIDEVVDADGDTLYQVEESADDDIHRWDTGDSPFGFGAVADIMRLSSATWVVNMGTATGADECGATIDFTAGTGGATNGEGGVIELDAGIGQGTGSGGGITIRSGNGGSTAGAGGLIFIQGGLGSGGGDGGALNFRGGPGSNAGTGGSATFQAGNSGTAPGVPGDTFIRGGFASVTSANSGNVTIGSLAGGVTSGNSGNLTLETGTASGTVGDILFNHGGVAAFEIDATGGTSGFRAANAAGPAIVNEAATSTNPTLLPNQADADTGIGWDSANVGTLVAGGVGSIKWDSGGLFGSNVNGPKVLDEAATSTNPTLVPNKSDTDTGIGLTNLDQLSLIAGGIAGIQLTEASSHVIIKSDMLGGLTASTTQTQGNGALISSYNEVATVANVNDTVTLIQASGGRHCLVINNGANTLQIFPASGDDLGSGVNVATTIASGVNVYFFAINGTNWEQI